MAGLLRRIRDRLTGGRVIARSGTPPPLRVRLRRRLTRSPKLSGDHTFDWTADDIINWKPPLVVPPELVRLAAMLQDFSPERRRVLAESETPNGWPAWWSRFYDRPGGWEGFKAECEEALTNYQQHGLPVDASLTLCELDRADGFTA
jgi:hypothetical protein